LQPVLTPEGLLDGMKAAALVSRDALDGGDLVATGLRGQDRAGLDRHAVQVNGAGTALAGVTADVGPGQLQLVAKKVDKQGSCGHIHPVEYSVDSDVNGDVWHA
jgi:hypothetical protein